jgi:hypothetical protein
MVFGSAVTGCSGCLIPSAPFANKDACFLRLGAIGCGELATDANVRRQFMLQAVTGLP